MDTPSSTFRSGRGIQRPLALAAFGLLAAASVASPARGSLLGDPATKYESIASPPVDAPDLSFILGDCIETKYDMALDGKTIFVTLTVRNTCYQRINIDAVVELVGSIAGTTRFWTLDSAHLVGKEPVVLHGVLTTGVVAQVPCMKMQGWWKPYSGTQPARPFGLDRCLDRSAPQH